VLEDKEIARTAVGVHNIKNLTLNTPAVLGNLTRSNAHLLTNKIAETNVNPLKQYYLNNHHLVVDPTTNPSVTNRFLIDSRNSPVLSTDLFFRSTLYDSTSMGASDETPLVLQGPELRVPEDFMSMGHDFKHYGTGKNFRNLIALSFNFDLYNTHWPAAPLYADYESRRWQSSELLEDVFWEEVVPGFYYYDYLFFKDHFNDYTYFHKNNVFGLRDYLFLDKKAIKKTIWKDYVVERPYLVDLAYNTAYPLAVTVDDDIVDYSTLSRQSFFSICKTNELNLVSDSAYDSLKSYNAYNNNFLMNTFVTTLGAIKVSTTLESFGMFRDDDDGLFNLVTPQKSNQTQVVPRVLVTNWHRLYERDQLLLLNRDMSLNLNLALMNSQPNFVLALKNVKMAFNSIQKVFRVKLDEMRSHARLSEYSQTGNQAMFVATARPAVKSWGGKNALDFVAAQTFKSTIQWPKNNLFMLATANNTSMFDFPFTTGVVNDATRYIWTDWSSKWKSREIVASSLAKYTMYGMNHVQRIFDFGTDVAANYRDSEQYISRLSHSRQNAINSWMFTPFGLLQSYMTSNQNLTLADCSIRTLLRVSSLCWTSVRLVEINSSLFFASQSGSYTPTRNYINLYNAIGAYQHYLTSLGDILTKREFMYRQLFEANSQWVNLPLTAIAAPSNPLFQELKTAFTYLDVTTLKSEYGRNEYLHNFNFTFRYTASGLLVGLFKFVRMNGFSMKGFSMDYFTNFAITKLVRDDTVLENYYFARRIWDVPNVPDSVLVKSQHKPMKKGIANMIKLHATGAIALPIEMRVQLLASSRDVIHSWSVPSAGVKIDCIPGYSSHRVITFLLSGIYWGQCMEICGRYHHWMPIIVYFMKRDLFLLWCIHFIFLRDNHNAMGVADRFYADFSETVSSDYTTWQQ
jgi:heme/copper-type cytochrome/quinol oxidase subunit 2